MSYLEAKTSPEKSTFRLTHHFNNQTLIDIGEHLELFFVTVYEPKTLAGKLFEHIAIDGMAETAPRKRCFVTIGATAPFDDLIMTVLTKPFLESLQAHGYSDLRIQYGKEGKQIFDRFVEARGQQVKEELDIDINGFGFDTNGLGHELIALKKSEKEHSADGLIISHAGKLLAYNLHLRSALILSGSGSILDGLRVGLPIIVVPNPKLMNNHQKELAEELARAKYVVHGRLM